MALPAPTPVGSIDVPLAGMTFPATNDPVCVIVIGMASEACVGLPCEERHCDGVAYCASSRSSVGGIAVGLGDPGQVCSADVPLARQAMEQCLFGAEPLDAGVLATTDAGVPDAPRPPPFDALVPRDAVAGEDARLARDVGPVPDGARPFGG